MGTRNGLSGRRPVSQITGEVLHPFVVEHHRYAARADEDRHPVPLYHGPRVIHLELTAAVQHHGERPERRPVAEGLEGVLEVLGRHRRAPRMSLTPSYRRLT